jgi:hypothetical protein
MRQEPAFGQNEFERPQVVMQVLVDKNITSRLPHGQRRSSMLRPAEQR